MADGVPTPPAPSNGNSGNGEKIVKSTFKAIFPALLLGLVGMILFVFLAGLFAQVYGSTTSFIFANNNFMALLGFFLGFGGYLGLKYEEYI